MTTRAAEALYEDAVTEPQHEANVVLCSTPARAMHIPKCTVSRKTLQYVLCSSRHPLLCRAAQPAQTRAPST